MRHRIQTLLATADGPDALLLEARPDSWNWPYAVLQRVDTGWYPVRRCATAAAAMAVVEELVLGQLA